MSNDKQQNDPQRRVFLRTVAFGGVAAGMLSASGIAMAAAAPTRQVRQAAADDEAVSRGYHESEHIREYYRKAAF